MCSIFQGICDAIIAIPKSSLAHITLRIFRRQPYVAQQLFQKVAQTITPEPMQNVKGALASSEIAQKTEAKKKAVPRKAAGQTWEDPTLADWPAILVVRCSSCLFLHLFFHRVGLGSILCAAFILHSS
ncbi:uncharacterized protein LOC132035477 isoform X2 [Lycium ferocissimum]|uniref:uncharacterized protein LOC132035477 isoform X2 n=1 Tax=Lycium ferocissimum TaxID=112874 RepID=UPI00281634EA|nr:uncharacterized protein LOC132035477 isoform X2 [Lycium ferocissimum]